MQEGQFSPIRTSWLEDERQQLEADMRSVARRLEELDVDVDAGLTSRLGTLLAARAVARKPAAAGTGRRPKVSSEEDGPENPRSTTGNRSSVSREKNGVHVEGAASEEKEASDEEVASSSLYEVLAVSWAEATRLNGGRRPTRKPPSWPVQQAAGDSEKARQRLLDRSPAGLQASVAKWRATKDAVLSGCLDLRCYFEQLRTGFEPSKEPNLKKGQVLAGRYEVRRTLGKAAFSTTFAAIDLQEEQEDKKKDEAGLENSERRRRRRRSVCLKVVANNKDFFDQSLDECKLLRYLKESGDVERHRVVELRDFFYAKEHLVIVTELLGENLYEWTTKNTKPLVYKKLAVRAVASDCLAALRYAHSLGIIHCDVKPENLVVVAGRRKPGSHFAGVKLIDFGSSCFVTDRPGLYVQSRSYRAPEVLLGAPYGPEIDVWSLGCVLAELLAGAVLFPNVSVPTLLASILAVLGPLPPRLLASARFKDSLLIGHHVFELRRSSWSSRCSPVPLRPSSLGSGPHSSSSSSSSSSSRERGQQSSSEISQHTHPYYDDHDRDLRNYCPTILIPKPTTLAARLDLLQPTDNLLVAFIHDLLQLDPRFRPSANSALRHRYFTADDLASPTNTSCTHRDQITARDHDGSLHGGPRAARGRVPPSSASCPPGESGGQDDDELSSSSSSSSSRERRQREKTCPEEDTPITTTEVLVV